MKNVIIGAGPAGRLAALELGKLNEEVLLIEKKHIAGTCLNEGCMVICALTDIARFLNNKNQYEKLGLVNGNINFSYVEITKKIKETQKILRKINQKENEYYKNEIIYGNAKIDESYVYVNGESYEYEKLLIATGARPFIPNIPGVKHGLISSDILEIKNIPEKLNVIGGGIIAAEVSNIFSSFGSTVNIFSRNNFLKELDPEIKEYIISNLYVDVNIYENIDILEIKKDKLITSNGEFEGKTFLASGRRANSDIVKDILDLNEDGTIKVNDLMETSQKNIYAAGDVIGGLNLTPIARMEGIIAARNMAGYSNKIEYRYIPQSITLDMDISFTKKDKKLDVAIKNKQDLAIKQKQSESDIVTKKKDKKLDYMNNNSNNNTDYTNTYTDNSDEDLINIAVPGVAGPGTFWKVLTKNTGLSKVSFNQKTNKIESIIGISPSSVSDVAYLSYLMRNGGDLENFDEFIEIHPSTDTFYKILKLL